MKNLNNITNHLGHIYSFPIRIGGFVIAMIGVIILLTKGWGILLGLLLILVGLYFGIAAKGISIDIKNKAVLHYTNILGYRKGNWNEFPTYCYTTVIRKDIKKSSFIFAKKHDATASYRFEIYLLSRSQRGKVLLEVVYNREDADFRAQRYADEMNVSVTEYEPPTRTKKTRKSSSRSQES